MQEDKYDKLLNASIVLLIVSATVLGITVYKTYLRPTSPIQSNKIAVVKPIVSKERDSLQNVYSSTIQAIDSSLLLDPKISADKDAQAKLAEVDVLKSEITTLLKDKNNEADLAIAKLKIEELQLKVALLQNRYVGVEADNKRLQALINQLIVNNRSQQQSGASNNALTAIEKTKPLLEKNNTTLSTTAADLRLFAVAENNTKEIETTYADDAEKMIGSFLFKNFAGKGNGEVMVVVVQPDGRVIKNSAWESGIFETREGKKVYSRKIYVEPQAEEKRLNFSLVPDSFIKGDYTLQIWYNGSMIAKTVKTLS
jgi:hypothetical protein